MKKREITLPILVALSASLAVVADDFKTIDGKEYKDAKVSRVEPDGIVLITKWGISKLYFTELPKEVQERFHYDAAKANAYAAEHNPNLQAIRKQQEQAARPTAPSVQKTNVTPAVSEPMATSGIEALPPISAKLRDELLDALKMTDKLDELFKGGCSSKEFINAALPAEPVFMNLQNNLPKGDPRRDLFANTFDAYQQVALALRANERGNAQRPDAIIAAAGVRKLPLTKILQGNMTPEAKIPYNKWREGLEADR
jgi:hypothetical protein